MKNTSRARSRRRLLALLLSAAALATAFPAVAHAQGSLSPTLGPQSGQLPTLAELFLFSPWINGMILLLSVLSLMMFLYLILSINVKTMVPSDFVNELRKLVERGKYDAAGDLCRVHRRVFVASIFQRCVENQNKSTSVVLAMAESEGQRRAEILWNRLSYLSDIANVAPMLGLLGTVLGMIKAFFLLERQAGTIDSLALSQGVGEAMSTTMFGLSVGIVTLVFYSMIKARITVMLAEAEQAVHTVVDHMKRESA